MTYHAQLLRSFSRQLEALRVESGLTQEAIARDMRCSSAKVSRMLNGGRLPTWADITMLVVVLEATAAQEIELLDTWALVKDSQPAFGQYKDVLSAGEIEYYEALQYADVAWLNATTMIPVILRTPEYHEAVLRFDKEALVPRWRELLPLIQRSHNPDRELNVMLDESVFLRYRVPGFHDQLDALLQAHKAGVCIQVLPFSVGPHMGMMQPFSILYWKEDPDATLMCLGWSHKPVDWVPELRRPQVRYDWQCLAVSGTEPAQLPAIIELAHRQRESGLRTVIPG